MRYQIFFYTQLLIISTQTFAQKFELGTRVQPNTQLFTQLDYSPSMKVHTYKYVGEIANKYLFDRRVGEIIIGVKNGVVVTLIFNLIPNKGEHKVSKSTLKLIKDKWKVGLYPIPNNKYVMTTGNKQVSLELTNNEMTFGQARIVYYTTIKYSLLMP